MAMKILSIWCLLLLIAVAEAQRRYRQGLIDSSLLSNPPLSAEGQAKDLDCNGTIEFEYITGYVYSSADDIIDSKQRTLKVTDCIQSCRERKECRAVNFETGLCILFRTAAGENSASLAVSQLPVFTLYAQKVCFPDRSDRYNEPVICTSPWAYETTPGMALLPGFVETEKETTTRTECAMECVNNQEFACRAASYDTTTGLCLLAGLNRNMAGRRQILTMNQVSDLIEISCVFSISQKMCEFEEIRGKILKTVDSVYQNVGDLEACKQKCLDEEFECNSYDFMSAETNSNICRLSHHTRHSLSHIQDPYIEVKNTVTYEKSKCIEVDVECRASQMITNIKMSTLFDGKVYVKNRPNTCVLDVENATFVEFTLPYNDIKCGVIREGEGAFFVDIVIQHHDMIVTAADMGLALQCRYELQNATVTNSLLSGLEVKEGIVTEHIKETIVSSPNVTMTIANHLQEEALTAQVGDDLFLVFKILDMKSPYEIFVRELIAMDGQDSSQIILIDEDGCPTDLSIMGAVSQVPGEKTLMSPFQAFKFPASDVVQFRALVTPCIPKCEPAICKELNVDGIIKESFGRKKRSIDDQSLMVAKSVRITDKFSFKDSMLRDSVTKELAEVEDSCISYVGVTVAAALFLMCQVIILMTWSYHWHKKRATKQIQPITGSLPAEIIYGTLSSRQTSTSRMTD